MKSTVVNRLALASAMAILLLLGLAYWWLDNLPHEIFGTAMFVLLTRHIFVNRLWFKNLLRGRYDARRMMVTVFHLLLIVNMAVLLMTSIAISKSVFSLLPIPDSVTLREFHWFSAYWVMIIVGIHLGIHWARVMAMAGSGFAMPRHGIARILLLRLAAALLGVFGVWSFSVLGVWTKLTFNYSLDFWDFNASLVPFFVYWLGVMALPAIITHYAIAWSRARGRSTSRAGRQRAPLRS